MENPDSGCGDYFIVRGPGFHSQFQSGIKSRTFNLGSFRSGLKKHVDNKELSLLQL